MPHVGYTNKVNMRRLRPFKLIIIGFCMVLFGAVVPMLMLLDIVEASFWLSFLTYAISVGGVFLGVIAAALYVGENKEP